MKCPNCSSENISSVIDTHTHTKEKDFSGGNACCGYVLFGWPGVLCGLCGSGSKTSKSTKTTHICNDCGRRF